MIFQKKKRKEMVMKIKDWFTGKQYHLWLNYCELKNKIYVKDLTDLDFEILLKERRVGESRMLEIQNRYNEFRRIEKKLASDNEILESIESYNSYMNNAWKNDKITLLNLKALPFFSDKTTDTIKSAELHESYQANILLSDIFFQKRTNSVMEISKITTIGEILFFTSKQLSKYSTCGSITIDTFQKVLSDFLLSTGKDFSGTWSDFDSMIESAVKIDARDYEILVARLGLNKKKVSTLQAVGNDYNMTRERIRQITRNVKLQLLSKNTIQKLWPFWDSIFGILNDYCGLVPSNILAKNLSKNLKWKPAMPGHALAFFINIFNRYNVNQKFDIIGTIDNKCVNCPKLPEFILEISKIKKETNENEVITAISERCIKSKCDFVKNKKNMNFKFVKFIISKMNKSNKRKIICEKNIIIKREYWIAKNLSVGGKITSALEAIGKPATIEEVINFVEKEHQVKYKKSVIVSVFNASGKCLLWKSGMYCHVKNTAFTNELLVKIMKYIRTKLSAGLPFVHVTGILSVFKKECSEFNLETYSALYYLLKKLKAEDIIFPYYPTAFLKKNYTEKKPLSFYMEEYLLQCNGTILNKQFNSFFIEEIGVKNYTLQYEVAGDDNIIRINSTQISHVDFF